MNQLNASRHERQSISLLVIDSRCIGRERIRRRLVAERAAVWTERIVDAVRFEETSGAEGIGRRVRIKRIGAQITEIFGGGGERTQQEQEEKKRHRVPLQNDRLGSRLLSVREHCKRSMMSAPSTVISPLIRLLHRYVPVMSSASNG